MYFLYKPACKTTFDKIACKTIFIIVFKDVELIQGVPINTEIQ